MAGPSRRGFAAWLAALPVLVAVPSALQARSAGPLARLPVTARYQIGRFGTLGLCQEPHRRALCVRVAR